MSHALSRCSTDANNPVPDLQKQMEKIEFSYMDLFITSNNSRATKWPSMKVGNSTSELANYTSLV